jgi:iron complex transport system permease protein
VVSLAVGAVPVEFAEMARVIAAKVGIGTVDDLSGTTVAVIWQIRVPRVLQAALLGAVLSVSGAVMQSLYRNPLADPALTGVSSGAALGAIGAILFHSPTNVWLVPAAACAGAFAATWMVFSLATARGTTSVAMLLLAGVGINAFAAAFISLAIAFADDVALRNITFWMLGSLGFSTWNTLAVTLPFSVALLVLAHSRRAALNALSLGEAEAGHLGFRVQIVKRQFLAAIAAAVGGLTAFAGMVGFVGLVVPHLVRLVLGPDHRFLIPASALFGACLTVMADTFARTAAAPAEIPLGAVTAALGAPFFLILLVQQKRRLAPEFA